jgi:hypothetical protein
MIPQHIHNDNDNDLGSMVRLKWTLSTDKNMTEARNWFLHKMLLCQKTAHNMA